MIAAIVNHLLQNLGGDVREGDGLLMADVCAGGQRGGRGVDRGPSMMCFTVSESFASSTGTSNSSPSCEESFTVDIARPPCVGGADARPTEAKGALAFDFTGREGPPVSSADVRLQRSAQRGGLRVGT